MNDTTPNAYLRTKILTANPAELRLMLIDGAIKFAGQAREGLIAKDYELVYNGASRCQKILMELLDGLRPEHDPELCERLSNLYTFMYTTLMQATTDKDPEKVGDVIKLLEHESETWSMVIEKLAEENRNAGTIDQTPDAKPVVPPTPDPAASSLVGGSISVTG